MLARPDGCGTSRGAVPRLNSLLFGARRAGAALESFLLPGVCAACERPLSGSDGGIVCGICWSRIERLRSPRCQRCGHPSDANRCRWCDLLPPFVRAVRSVCWISGGTGSAIVHALKYGGWTRIAGEMAARMARLDWPADVVAERTAYVPVPLSPDRQRERGFNQSALLAEALGCRSGLPTWPALVQRTRSTRTQTRLTPGERASNVAGAFHTPADATSRVSGAHLVLVDDVVTTCATLNACAAALFAGGARIISYVTFGRAPQVGDRP